MPRSQGVQHTGFTPKDAIIDSGASSRLPLPVISPSRRPARPLLVCRNQLFACRYPRICYASLKPSRKKKQKNKNILTPPVFASFSVK